MHVQLSSVSKRYGKVHALRDVSLLLQPGQLVAVLGLNGAGKSTLLRCLAGVVAADGGELLCDGRPFSRGDMDLRRRIFFLPDFPLLFWDRSVIHNLSVIARLYGRDDAAAPERAFGLLRELDLLPLAQAPAGTLSRGQMHKTALAALLLVDPELWLLDEPLSSGMDPLALSFFKREARAAAARGRTVVYSTQLLDVAERFADRVAVLHEGRLRAWAGLEELRAGSLEQDAASPLESLFRKLRESPA
jgi:ABC-2 type transport system ATP-binding protein